MEQRPIPGKVIRREEHEHYVIVEEEPAGWNQVGFTWLETACVGKCKQIYRIDPHHHDYTRIKDALNRGDRSVLFCYHKPLRF